MEENGGTEENWQKTPLQLISKTPLREVLRYVWRVHVPGYLLVEGQLGLVVGLLAQGVPDIRRPTRY